MNVPFWIAAAMVAVGVFVFGSRFTDDKEKRDLNHQDGQRMLYGALVFAIIGVGVKLNDLTHIRVVSPKHEVWTTFPNARQEDPANDSDAGR